MGLHSKLGSTHFCITCGHVVCSPLSQNRNKTLRVTAENIPAIPVAKPGFLRTSVRSILYYLYGRTSKYFLTGERLNLRGRYS